MGLIKLGVNGALHKNFLNSTASLETSAANKRLKNKYNQGTDAVISLLTLCSRYNVPCEIHATS